MDAMASITFGSFSICNACTKLSDFISTSDILQVSLAWSVEAGKHFFQWGSIITFVCFQIMFIVTAV